MISDTEQWEHDEQRAMEKEIERLREQLASRDAEVVSLTNQRDYEYVRAENAEQERDQLREQVKVLRDVLQITHELYTQASSGYGFAHPENPHNYSPDFECCSEEEIAAHSKACEDYDAGRKIANDSWGTGTYCDEYAPALKALAATEADFADLILCKREPVAAQLMVRFEHTGWKRYNVYDDLKTANWHAAQCEGDPLLIRVIPLYAAAEVVE